MNITLKSYTYRNKDFTFFIKPNIAILILWNILQTNLFLKFIKSSFTYSTNF